MESYIRGLRHGLNGVNSGIVTPIELEIQTEEEIDIVKPRTFDPNHPGLLNLSPKQIKRFMNLADKRDNEETLNA